MNREDIITNLRLWAGDDIVPGDLASLCNIAAKALAELSIPEAGEFSKKLRGILTTKPPRLDFDKLNKEASKDDPELVFKAGGVSGCWISLTDLTDACDAIDTQAEQIKRLREALNEYGRHGKRSDGIMCEKDKHSDYLCSCGLEQVLKEAPCES